MQYRIGDAFLRKTAQFLEQLRPRSGAILPVMRSADTR
nr:MAG TPA: hypothetical protein [Bacteriophage sp.]